MIPYNHDYSTDMDNNNITLDVDFKKPVTLDGNYDIKGKVMVLPITGEGMSKIMLGNCKLLFSLIIYQANFEIFHR